MHSDIWCADGLNTLNQLSGFPFDDAPKAAQNAAQQAAVDRISTLYRRVPAPPAELTPAGALRELCGSASRYLPTEPSTTAPYTKDLVSWPPEGTKATPIGDLLSDADQSMVYDWETSILRDDSEVRSHFDSASRVKPFLEPTLVRRPQVYAEFLQRLEAAGMLVWRVGGPSLLGFFFCEKE
jgi:hypothetical protein